jgi:hypothetical protein
LLMDSSTNSSVLLMLEHWQQAARDAIAAEQDGKRTLLQLREFVEVRCAVASRLAETQQIVASQAMQEVFQWQQFMPRLFTATVDEQQGPSSAAASAASPAVSGGGTLQSAAARLPPARDGAESSTAADSDGRVSVLCGGATTADRDRAHLRICAAVSGAASPHSAREHLPLRALAANEVQGARGHSADSCAPTHTRQK